MTSCPPPSQLDHVDLHLDLHLEHVDHVELHLEHLELHFEAFGAFALGFGSQVATLEARVRKMAEVLSAVAVDTKGRIEKKQSQTYEELQVCWACLSCFISFLASSH